MRCKTIIEYIIPEEEPISANDLEYGFEKTIEATLGSHNLIGIKTKFDEIECKFCKKIMKKEESNGIWLVCRDCSYFYNPETKEEHLEP